MKVNPLGKKTAYAVEYDPSLLFFISRKDQRIKNRINEDFAGYDVWNAYELSWLDRNGKPQTRVARIIYSADSENMVESKSLKLYLNGFSMTKMKDEDEIINIIRKDLGGKIKAEYFDIRLFGHDHVFKYSEIKRKYCIDGLKICCDKYDYDRTLLKVKKTGKKEITRITNLLKTNCPITGQPDWATLFVSYKSENIIDDESLLKYVISFRNENDYHENCCERIYTDIFNLIHPEKLTVKCFYTRRGGIEINPVRFGKNINDKKFGFHFWRQ